MDEFDNALMEALNEAVPPADFTTDLASRLVARTHRRTRFWKLLLVLSMFSAAAGSIITVTALSTGTTGGPPVETDSGSDWDSRHLGGGTSDWDSRLAGSGTSDWDSRLLGGGSETAPSTLNSQQGALQVQSTTLKKAAALTGALALAAATPTRADGYQFIVSGYPAANPSHSDVSSGMSLAGGPLGDVSAAAALEARARTCDDSAGIALRSDEFKAMIIIFK
jgi:hypothetical protein